LASRAFGMITLIHDSPRLAQSQGLVVWEFLTYGGRGRTRLRAVVGPTVSPACRLIGCRRKSPTALWTALTNVHGLAVSTAAFPRSFRLATVRLVHFEFVQRRIPLARPVLLAARLAYRTHFVAWLQSAKKVDTTNRRWQQSN
jgi:hypothetical protein